MPVPSQVSEALQDSAPDVREAAVKALPKVWGTCHEDHLRGLRKVALGDAEVIADPMQAADDVHAYIQS